MVLTRDNRVLDEFYHEFDVQSLKRAVLLRPFGQMAWKIKRVDQSVGLLAAPQGWNYYHWLFDVLPRVHLLQNWSSIIDKYAVPNSLSDVQLESLRILGISETQLLPLHVGERLRCRHLYAPSLPGSEGCYPPWAISFLQENLGRSASSSAGRGPLIYIKRGPFAQRRILNEEALIERLAARGYKSVSLEEHSMAEQIAIFRDARIIIGAHGAGLANMVFTQKGTALLELFSADYLRPDCYFTLSKKIGHSYDFWVDAATVSSRKPWGAMIIDIDAVETKAKSLCNKQ
jgi:capsular polysaccharide biosynthesis protein